MPGIIKRIPNPILGVYGTRKDVGLYFHTLVTTTNGTIDTTNSDQAADSAVTVVKTAAKTGRYSFTLPAAHRKLLSVTATIIGPADVSYGVITKGLPMFVRNNAVSTAGTFDAQFAQGDTNWVDGELADAAQVMFTIMVAN